MRILIIIIMFIIIMFFIIVFILSNFQTFSVGDTWRCYCLLGSHVKFSLQHRCLCPRWEREISSPSWFMILFSDSVNGGHSGNGSADEGVYCPNNQTLGEPYIYNHTLLPTRCFDNMSVGLKVTWNGIFRPLKKSERIVYPIFQSYI